MDFPVQKQVTYEAVMWSDIWGNCELSAQLVLGKTAMTEGRSSLVCHANEMWTLFT